MCTWIRFSVKVVEIIIEILNKAIFAYDIDLVGDTLKKLNKLKD